MKTYQIRTVNTSAPSLNDPVWDTVEKAVLDETGFSPDVECPKTECRIVAAPDGFTIRFDCAEKDPAAHYSGLHDPAWLDSCVEFFFAPDNDDPAYFNFEQSAGGALLIQKGTNRFDRVNVGDDIRLFGIEREMRKDGWSVRFFIPFSFIRLHFAKLDASFRGNLQFCNEDKGMYPVWNRIETPQPDYHQSSFFGTFMTE